MKQAFQDFVTLTLWNVKISLNHITMKIVILVVPIIFGIINAYFDSVRSKLPHQTLEMPRLSRDTHEDPYSRKDSRPSIRALSKKGEKPPKVVIFGPKLPLLKSWIKATPVTEAKISKKGMQQGVRALAQWDKGSGKAFESWFENYKVDIALVVTEKKPRPFVEIYYNSGAANVPQIVHGFESATQELHLAKLKIGPGDLRPFSSDSRPMYAFKAFSDIPKPLETRPLSLFIIMLVIATGVGAAALDAREQGTLLKELLTPANPLVIVAATASTSVAIGCIAYALYQLAGICGSLYFGIQPEIKQLGLPTFVFAVIVASLVGYFYSASLYLLATFLTNKRVYGIVASPLLYFSIGFVLTASRSPVLVVSRVVDFIPGIGVMLSWTSGDSTRLALACLITSASSLLVTYLISKRIYDERFIFVTSGSHAAVSAPVPDHFAKAFETPQRETGNAA